MGRFHGHVGAAVVFPSLHWPRAGGIRAVAQLGSALDWGSRGRRFKSCQPDREVAPDLRRRGSGATQLVSQIALSRVHPPRTLRAAPLRPTCAGQWWGADLIRSARSGADVRGPGGHAHRTEERRERSSWESCPGGTPGSTSGSRRVKQRARRDRRGACASTRSSAWTATASTAPATQSQEHLDRRAQRAPMTVVRGTGNHGTERSRSTRTRQPARRRGGCMAQASTAATATRVAAASWDRGRRDHLPCRSAPVAVMSPHLPTGSALSEVPGPVVAGSCRAAARPPPANPMRASRPIGRTTETRDHHLAQRRAWAIRRGDPGDRGLPAVGPPS